MYGELLFTEDEKYQVCKRSLKAEQSLQINPLCGMKIAVW